MPPKKPKQQQPFKPPRLAAKRVAPMQAGPTTVVSAAPSLTLPSADHELQETQEILPLAVVTSTARAPSVTQHRTERVDLEEEITVVDDSDHDEETSCSAASGSAAVANSRCHHKSCKKVAKPVDEITVRCGSTGCSHHIHPSCSTAMTQSFGDPAFDGTVCGKRCYNALIKLSHASEQADATKKRIPWHNDGYTPSISSMSCLIDWLTTGTNYERFCGGDSQSGDTKIVIAGEIVRFIAECGVTTVRTAKDVLTKIYALEQSYKAAADWLAHTGQGITYEPSLKSASTRGASTTTSSIQSCAKSTR